MATAGLVLATSTRERVPAEPLPVAERRVCSVLFADLVGFTPLTEHQDPEDVRELRLAKARLKSSQGVSGSTEAMVDAVNAVRRVVSPWHLGYALVDHAQHHQTVGDPGRADELLREAQAIALAVGAVPLLDRIAVTAVSLQRTETRAQG
ncbi:MAG: hypothetical protein ABJA81_05575 [Nocardioidaceae bacterium]